MSQSIPGLANHKSVSHIFVGSANPVKVNAVVTAASETWPEVKILGIETASGISEQPFGDSETKLGAHNRAVAALKAGLNGNESKNGTQSPDKQNLALGVGLEGGVTELEDGLYSTVWVAVTDQTGLTTYANGARFLVPELIAKLIRSGEEMGPVVEKIIGQQDVRQKQGMIGVITNGFVDRTEEYSGIAKMALGLWYGQDWASSLES